MTTPQEISEGPPLPENLTLVEGFTTREQYLQHVSRFKTELIEAVGELQATIILPLNGALVPFYHGLAGLISSGKLQQVQFVLAAKDEQKNWFASQYFDIDQGRKIIVIDDIADTCTSKGQMDDQLESVTTLHAMSRRVVTLEYVGNHAVAPIIGNRQDTTPPWVLSGYGMNSSKASDPHITALERWADRMLIGAETDPNTLPQGYQVYLEACQFLPLDSPWFQVQLLLEQTTDFQTKLRICEDFMQQVLQAPRSYNHSHSIVAGGLVVMSYTTRETFGTSFTIREEIFCSTS
ncbi:hypothetical protein KC726_00810 [Candidatus Woesebacteria bacterium]|nr:hypothetical protein [Candidatus Woesebacteria bacterium]